MTLSICAIIKGKVVNYKYRSKKKYLIYLFFYSDSIYVFRNLDLKYYKINLRLYFLTEEDEKTINLFMNSVRAYKPEVFDDNDVKFLKN